MVDRSFRLAVHNAWQGIVYAVRTEPNLKRQLVMMILVMVAALVLQCSRYDIILLLMVSGLVVGFELVNSALEGFEDVLHPQQHPLIQKSKDMAAGGVLVVSCMAVIVGLLIFIPRLISFF